MGVDDLIVNLEAEKRLIKQETSKLDKIFILSIILNQISVVLLTLEFGEYGIFIGIAGLVFLFYGLLRGDTMDEVLQFNAEKKEITSEVKIKELKTRIKELEKELEKKDTTIKKALDVIRFYASVKTWLESKNITSGKTFRTILVEDSLIVGNLSPRGGKRATEFLDWFKGVIGE